MINTAIKEIHSEVYAILNLLGDEYIKKIPLELYRMIEESKLYTYNKQITIQDLIDGNIKRESLSMIALFHLKYWCKSDEEKRKLQELFSENEQKYQEKLREKYNPDSVFKTENKEKTTEVFEEVNVSKETSMVEYKESIFKRIIKKIKSFF